MVLRGRERNLDSAYRLGALALLMAIFSMAIALGFEHLGGMAPCPLCLMQRWAYYAGIPVLFVALVLVAADRPLLGRLSFIAVALAFLANAGLGVYHAGAEWQFWPGPDTCASAAGPVQRSVGGLLQQLGNATPVIRCDRAAWRFLGLSFAGWNVVASLALVATTVHAARHAK